MAYTQRVQPGSAYTDGERLWEVTEVCPLGLVVIRDASVDSDLETDVGMREVGIDAFRRQFWLVREP